MRRQDALLDTERQLRRGIAAQDFRASRARAVDRPDAVLCAECGTELDVAEPAHNPLRPCWAPPDTTTRDERQAEHRKRRRRLAQPWAKGAGKMRRISRLSHDALGDVTTGELDRRHAAWAAQQPMTIWCVVCGKRYEGEARRIVKLLRSHVVLKHHGSRG